MKAKYARGSGMSWFTISGPPTPKVKPVDSSGMPAVLPLSNQHEELSFVDHANVVAAFAFAIDIEQFLALQVSLPRLTRRRPG